jgi:hypothetical protein
MALKDREQARRLSSLPCAALRGARMQSCHHSRRCITRGVVVLAARIASGNIGRKEREPAPSCRNQRLRFRCCAGNIGSAGQIRSARKYRALGQDKAVSLPAVPMPDASV